MFYYFFASNPDGDLYLNLFRYLTFRSGAALLTAFALMLVFAPWWLQWLRRIHANTNTVRKYLTESHAHKRSTPSMGGSIILLTVIISSLIWLDLTNRYVWLVIVTIVYFGLIGGIDDYLKLGSDSTTRSGLTARTKLLLQIVGTLIIAYLYTRIAPENLATLLSVPVLKNFTPDLGLVFFILFQLLVVVGSSNAVNITDGLDGLAIVPVIMVCATFALIVYLAGNSVYSSYLQIISVPGSGELSIICAAIIGSGLGFLWFNAPPAQVFMGDSGALSLGATLGVIAMIAKHELVLVIAGGLFVLEMISVIVQVVSFKLTGKRVFAMAPLHHHYEKRGWPESTIVIRFWIIAFVLALISLASLKIR